MAEIPERWILYFEDVDKKDWHFDDRRAAEETLKLQLQSWSCHLFVNSEQLNTAEARIRELEQALQKIEAETIDHVAVRIARAALAALHAPYKAVKP